MNEPLGLFKYLSPDSDKLVLFENRLVLLTPPIYLDDPWDFRPKGRFPSEDEILQAWREMEANIAGSPVITLPAEFASQAQLQRLEQIQSDVASTEFLAAQNVNYQSEISKIVGVTSLTELPLCRLMWAYYAKSHTGFVAEFGAVDRYEEYGFALRPCALGFRATTVAAKVRYRPYSEQPSLTKNAENVLDVCCTKHLKWEDQGEWRIVWPLKESIACTLTSKYGEPQKRFCLMFAPRGLRRVIFGMRMKPEVRQRLCDMLGREEFKHVQKQVTDIDPQTGDLVVKPFESL